MDETNQRIAEVEVVEYLNLPEADKKWSMLQCVAHMSLTAKVYVQNIGQAPGKASNQRRAI